MNTAISTNFLLWALILFCCPHPGWTTQAEEMASLEVKMTNIMDRMTRMEAEMVKKDQRMAELDAAMEDMKAEMIMVRDQSINVEEAMEVKDKRIAVLEDAIKTTEKGVITKDDFTKEIETRDTQMCELEEEMASLTGRMDVTEETDVLLRGMVDQVWTPPFAFQCAWHGGYWTADNSVITYDRLTYDEISGGSIYNVTGGLDINTGEFTVGQGYAGTWEISYSMRSIQDNAEFNYAWLYINGEKIAESQHLTDSGRNGKYFESLGSRSLYMRLESGDTISLRTGDIRILADITLCFNLAQFD